jgi:hypothetical protein
MDPVQQTLRESSRPLRHTDLRGPPPFQLPAITMSDVDATATTEAAAGAEVYPSQ